MRHLEQPLEHSPQDGPASLAAVEEEIHTALATDTLELPHPPDVLPRVWQVLADPDKGPADVAGEIAHDPGMAARLLKVANSAFYGRARPVSDLPAAVVRLGSDGVHQVLCALALRSLYGGHRGPLAPLLEENWAESLMVAGMAAHLARSQPHLEEGVALVAGLVHRVGALPLIDFAERHTALAGDPDAVRALVARLHCGVGQTVANRWRFPEHLVRVIADYRDPHPGRPEPPDYVDLVAAAALIAAVHTDPGNAGLFTAGDALLHRVGLETDDLQYLLALGEEGKDAVRSLLAVDEAA